MTRDDLLRAVIDAPDDDLPRLAYADYLDETGLDPARAAFIRLDVEAGRFPLDHPDRAAADRAARNLYLENWNRWAAELPAGFTDHGRPSFYRGFVEEVVVSAEWFADHANELLLSAPIHTVRLRLPTPSHRPYALFSGKVELFRILRLEFDAGVLIPETRVGTNIGGAWHTDPTNLDDLLSCPTLTGLRELYLGFNHLGPEGGLTLARRLTIAAFSRSLRTLDASHCGLMAAGSAALSSGPKLPNLKTLHTAMGVHTLSPDDPS